MRWEVLSTRIQESDANGNPRKRFEALLFRIYTAMLRLYPAAFRTAFSDEMRDVFSMTLRESAGHMALIQIICREIILFPLSLIAVHRTAFNQLPAPIRRRKQMRWFVRIIGGMLGVFMLSTLRILLSPSYNLYPQAVPFVVALFIASVSLLLALRWGRVGGLLSIISGTGIGCCMTLYAYVMGLDEVGIVGIVLIGLLWALPFLIFGILFYELSYPPKQAPIRA